jgi:hypothetical protein
MKTQNMNIEGPGPKGTQESERAGVLMKKQKKEQWRTEANDQPLAITATPA